MKNFIHKPRKDRSRGKGAMAAALLFLCILFVHGSLFPAQASQVTLEAEYGYDNTAKGGRYLPLSVAIDNPAASALDGTLIIKSQESDGTVYQYEYQVQAGAQGRTAVQYYIPLGAGASRLFLSLVDQDGTTVAWKDVRLNVSRDVPELFIGILSDDPEELSYLDGVGIRYSTLRTRTFFLSAEEIPEDEIGLNLLDVLVVNNYKLRNLSEAQTAAMMDWVHSGGILILGTGERVDDTLGRFAPELLDDSYGTPSQRPVNLGESYSLENPGDGMIAMDLVNISLHGGNVILSSGGQALLTAAAKEQGLIAVAGFDLGDIGAFCRKHSGYVDQMFTDLMGETRINRLAEVVYGGNSSKFWSVQSMINTGNVDKLPKLTAYVAVVLIYLLVLGPGLYLFLRNRGLYAWYRRSVVMLSLAFAGIIYVMGIPTRFRSTFFTYATVRDVTSDYIADVTYLNIRNPYNRPYQVSLNPAYSVLPITRSSSDGNGESFQEDAPYQIAVSYGENATCIEGQNISAFAPRYFQLERKMENTEAVGISGEVNYYEGSLTGSLTNHFSFPLENTALVLYGTMVQIGRMEPGETKQLSDFELLRFPLGNSYEVADRISGESAYGNVDINDSSYLLAMERSNMLRFYLDTYLNTYTADARVLAFSTEKEESPFLSNGTEETYGLTMLTSSVAVNASWNRYIYRSVLMKTPRVISGSYEESTNSMGSGEPLTLEYQLGEDIDVDSLTFETVSDVFLNEETGSYSRIFEGSIYFYNYGSGNYDLMELEGRTLTLEQLASYLSPANTLTVRYAYSGGGGYNAIQLPMPMVAGEER